MTMSFPFTGGSHCMSLEKKTAAVNPRGQVIPTSGSNSCDVELAQQRSISIFDSLPDEEDAQSQLARIAQGIILLRLLI